MLALVDDRTRIVMKVGQCHGYEASALVAIIISVDEFGYYSQNYWVSRTSAECE